MQSSLEFLMFSVISLQVYFYTFQFMSILMFYDDKYFNLFLYSITGFCTFCQKFKLSIHLHMHFRIEQTLSFIFVFGSMSESELLRLLGLHKIL